MMTVCRGVGPLLLVAAALLVENVGAASMLGCSVSDSANGRPLACRVYLQSTDGRWWFARADTPEGSAIEYRKQRTDTSVEMHTTVSAHPFVFDLPPGDYRYTIERGKEYLPLKGRVRVGGQDQALMLSLTRWIDMAQRGWYSGDTHVHRTVDELRNLLLAEDLNVGLPLTYWVTTSHTPPTSGDKNANAEDPAELITLDDRHVIYPMNTEYEIFRVGDQRHTLGAVFVLGHREPLELGVPPVAPIAEEARRQGALLDLDKHSWPWSLMLMPVMRVDLFELSNNHVWRTEFAFRQWTIDAVPDYMHVQRDEAGLTEWGWIDFGFQTYYALLNCGYRLRPTAGTANGVHPVPLGFGRVYVHLPDGFSYQGWMKGLAEGNSFVTTGPMLDVQVDGQRSGTVIRKQRTGPQRYRIHGVVNSAHPLKPIEIVSGGRVVESIAPENRRNRPHGFESVIDVELETDDSTWIAVRAFEDRPDGRVRFAHSSPVHVEMPGSPCRPNVREVEYLTRRMREELERNRTVLSEQALDEYRQALRAFEQQVGEP